MDTFSNIKNILVKFYDEYNQTTPKKLKIVDAYLFYIMLTGIIQFVYCCLVGTFPFNSFLSGFISCVGSFVLGGKKIYRANADVHSFYQHVLRVNCGQSTVSVSACDTYIEISYKTRGICVSEVFHSSTEFYSQQFAVIFWKH